MALTINTNIQALTAYRNLSAAQASQQTSVERLSSGLRINKAADDAAGLAISQGLTAQINGLGQAVRNSQDGINVVQTADGALTEVQSILQRVRTLTVQGANDSNDSKARANILTEVNQLSKELDRIGATTKFNGQSLLNGDTAADYKFQVGSDTGAANQIEANLSGAAGGLLNGIGGNNKIDGSLIARAFTTADATEFTGGATTVTAGVSSTANLVDSGTAATGTTADAWNKVLTQLDSSISKVSTLRANLGAIQNRLQHTINNISVTQTNLQASNSSIVDADVASEVSNMTRTNVLVSAGTSVLKQANQSSQNILSLLQ